MEPNKIKKIAIIALIFAIIGWELPVQSGTIWVVNNTNLAPSFAGEPPGINTRGANNTTYWANNSPIQLFVFAHADRPGDTAEIHLFINGTKVADTSGKPLGVAESNNRTVVATIPQYANYSVNITNFHHYEWREYQILTGQVSTNLTGSTGGSSAPCTNCVNYTQLSDNMSLKVNKSGDTMTGILNMSGSNITNVGNITMMDGLISNITNVSYFKSIGGIYVTDGPAGNLVDTTTSAATDPVRTERNSSQVWRMITAVDASGGNNFGANKARGNLVSPSVVIFNDVLFSAFGNGWDGSIYSAKNARVTFRAMGLFNTTYHPTSVDFLTTNGTTDTLNTAVRINQSASVEILVPGRGIQFTSPNGLVNACMTLNNAGVIITTAGKCPS